MMQSRKSMLHAGVPLILSVLALTGCEGAAQPERKQAPQAVEVLQLQTSAVPLVTELPGRTVPFRIAQIRPQVSGIIRKINFDEGGDVSKGQSLYQIDAASYEAAYGSAKANLMSARAQLSVAKLKAEQYRPLAEIKAISQLELAKAETARQQAEADVAAAQSALEQARINLRYTDLVSPIQGRSGRSSVSEGALVTADQAAPLTIVQQIDPILVDVTQSSKVLLQLRRDHAGQHADPEQAPVTLILEDGSAYEHTGTLQFSEVTVDQATGSVTLRAIFPNPDQILLPGMFVHMRVPEGVDENALLIPQEALTHDAQGQATALIVNDENLVVRRGVTTGRAVGNQWLVSSGLQAGDRIIVSGTQHVKPGDKVEPRQWAQKKEEPATQKPGAMVPATAG